MKRIYSLLLFAIIPAYSILGQASISLSTDSIYLEINAGDTIHLPLTISNTGDEDLYFDIDFEDFGGKELTFTKHDSADWTLEQYQDRISDSVWITRANSKGLFNIAVEDSYEHAAPANTEWSFGLSKDLEPDDYTFWENAIGGRPPQMIGQPLSLHLIWEDVYLDLIFHQWTSAGRGGGFSYTRMPAFQWLDLSDYVDTVQNNTSDELMMIIDAADLEAGMHQQALLISSNDPQNPEIRLPVSINVVDAPGIRVDADTMDFGIVFLGVTDTIKFVVSNSGTVDLLIPSVAIDNDAFDVTPGFAGIDPGESETFTVTFHPDVVAYNEGILTLNTNDPTNSQYLLALKGSGAEPPVVTVGTDSIFVELNTGDSTNVNLNIGNAGNSILNYKLNFIPVGTSVGSTSINWIKLGTDIQESEAESNYFDIKNVYGAVNGDKVLIKISSYNKIYSDYFNPNYIALFLDIDQDNTSGFNLNDIFNLDFGLDYYIDGTDILKYENNDFVQIQESAESQFVEGSYEVILSFSNEFLNGANVINIAVLIDEDQIPEPDAMFEHLEFPFIAPWLSAEDIEGVLEKDTNKDISIKFNAKGMFDGDYKAKITIDSNDPVNPRKDVVAALHVNGFAEYSGPDSLFLGTSFVGYRDSAYIFIENTGTADLELSDFRFGSSQLTSNIDSLTIPPQSEDSIKIVLTGTQAVEFSDTLRMQTNDLEANEVIVLIGARIYDPPELTLSSDDIAASVVGSGTTSESFTISNSGGYSLGYDISYMDKSSILTFDDPLSFVRIPMSWDNTPTSGVSISLWVKLDEDLDCDGQNNWRVLLYKGTSFANGSGFDVVIEEDGILTWSLGLENGVLRYHGGMLHTNVWTHVSFVYDAKGEADIYINGNKANGEYWEESSGNIIPNWNNFILNTDAGECQDGLGHLPGQIHEVQMWDRALTAEEIKINMYRVLDGQEDNLVAYWPMDEGSGIDIYDKGPNSLHGYFFSYDGTEPQWITTDHFAWLTVNPVYGNIGTSNPSTINLNFDALDLDPGVYFTDIIINSSDPEQSLTRVPVTFTIDEESIGINEDVVSPGIRNYPNPFSSETFIKYTLEDESRVVINIFNALGQQVQILVDDTRQKGLHKVKWDGMSKDGLEAESGVYNCRIDISSAGMDKTSKYFKLLLIR